MQLPQAIQQALQPSLQDTQSPPQAPQQSSLLSPQQPGEGNGILPIQSIHNFGMHVSDLTKQNIVHCKRIEPNSSLPPFWGQRVTTCHKKSILSSAGEINTKETAKKVNSIKWTDSMHIFASLYLTAHPIKSAKLIKYIHRLD